MHSSCIWVNIIFLQDAHIVQVHCFQLQCFSYTLFAHPMTIFLKNLCYEQMLVFFCGICTMPALFELISLCWMQSLLSKLIHRLEEVTSLVHDLFDPPECISRMILKTKFNGSSWFCTTLFTFVQKQTLINAESILYFLHIMLRITKTLFFISIL